MSFLILVSVLTRKRSSWIYASFAADHNRSFARVIESQLERELE